MNPASNLAMPNTWPAYNEAYDFQLQQAMPAELSPISPLDFEGGWLTDSPLESSLDGSFSGPEPYDYAYDYEALNELALAFDPHAENTETRRQLRRLKPANLEGKEGKPGADQVQAMPRRAWARRKYSVYALYDDWAKIKQGRDLEYKRIASLQKQVKHMEEMSRLLDVSLNNQSTSRFHPLPPNLSYRYPEN
ncbi:hypothetical protein RhiLY_06443 [Ceratobasidium sp. AG-Ba]|nr:hypothetical protein RhiLY_06443 [Ceratobasidium sp. AG-Ba]